MLRQNRRLFGQRYVPEVSRIFGRIDLLLRNDGCRFKPIAVPPKMKRAAK